MLKIKPRIIKLLSIDSTNNYAMRLIDGNTAQTGMTIVAKTQTDGKGQRGRHWVDIAGESLLMSIIVTPSHSLTEQFLFNSSVSVAIANVLQNLSSSILVSLKWPNDIIINDKKAGGILIENVLRGSSWAYSVVGIGLNVNQAGFLSALPFATSLKIEAGLQFDLDDLLLGISTAILEQTSSPISVDEQLRQFNTLLFKRGKHQLFSDGTRQWEATILNAQQDGTLQVQLESGEIVNYIHGQVSWVYS